MPDSLNVGGVECYVLIEGGMSLGVTGEGPTASVVLQCLWDDWFKVLQGLAGGSSADENGAITYTAPYLLPVFGGLIALGVPEIAGVGKPRRDADGLPAWQFAQIKTQFGVPRYSFDAGPGGGEGWTGYEPGVDISGRPYTTTRVRVNSDIMVPPGGALFFTDGTQAGQPIEDSQAGLPIPNIEISMTRHMMPYVPLSQAKSLIGTVNETDVYLGGVKFDPGYVLFAGFNSSREILFTGAWSNEVEYIILAQAIHSWNQILDRAGRWSLINTKSDGSGDPAFKTSDFWNLLV